MDMNRTILIVFCLMCIVGTASAAISVSSVSVSPSGTLTPGTHVTTSYTVDSSGVFPSGDDLQFYTDLDNPKWTYAIIVSGLENPRPAMSGRTLTITGFELSYSPSTVIAVRATLEGDVPAVTQTGDKTIVRIQEIDSNGRSITSTQFSKTAVVNNGQVNPTTIATTIPTTIPTTISTTMATTSVTQTTTTPFRLTGHASSYMSRNPLEDLTSGASVAATYRVEYSEVFPSSHDLKYYTDLNNPQWTYTVIENGISNPVRTSSMKSMSIPGFELAYPPSVKIILNVQVQGIAPMVSQPTSISVMRVSEIDNQGVSLLEANNDAMVRSLANTPITSAPTLSITPMTTTGSVTPTPHQTNSVTILPTTKKTNTTPTKSVNQLLEEQNKKIEEQNKLIAEQNKKIAEQSGLLDQIIQMFKGLFGQS